MTERLLDLIEQWPVLADVPVRQSTCRDTRCDLVRAPTHRQTRLHRLTRHVRRQDHVRQGVQRTVLGKRLDLGDVKARSGKMPGLDRLDERSLIDDWPARRIDQVRTLLHLCQSFGIDQVARTRCQERVHAHEVGVRKHIVERCHRHAISVSHFLGYVGVIRKHLETERTQALGREARNHPKPDQPDGLHRKTVHRNRALRATALVSPRARPNEMVRDQQLLVHSKDQRQRVVRNLFAERIRDIREQDPVRSCRIDVNVVVTHEWPQDQAGMMELLDVVSGQADTRNHHIGRLERTIDVAMGIVEWFHVQFKALGQKCPMDGIVWIDASTSATGRECHLANLVPVILVPPRWQRECRHDIAPPASGRHPVVPVSALPGRRGYSATLMSTTFAPHRAEEVDEYPHDYASLLALDHAHLLHPQHHPADHAEAVIFDRGEGAILWDVNGKRYIDGLACLWNVFVGHGRQELADAGAAQMRKLAFVNSYVGSSNEPAITLAARLARLAPGDHLNTVFFTTGGAESSDTAFKTVRRYWALKGQPEKSTIISRTNGYHGTTIGATAATGLAAFHPNWGPPAPGFVMVPPMDIEAIEAVIAEHGAGTIAAIIAEPVQGSGGVYPPPADYFPRLRALCDHHDIILIADEVITGFGRTGTFWGLDQWNVVPDVISFAKGVTSGYQPLGGIIISDAIREVIYNQPSASRWWHAFTYSAHATCCAVAHANLDIIENEGLVARAAIMGARLQTGLRAYASHPAVREVRGLGLMGAVEFNPGSVPGGVPALAKAMRERGLFTRTRNDIVMFAPPLVITETELDELLAIFGEAVNATIGH